jgi:hypothetical protein
VAEPVSFKVRAEHLGGHWHVAIWSSEFGPDTTHGRNGTLVFRETEWPAFKQLLMDGPATDPIEIIEVD